MRCHEHTCSGWRTQIKIDVYQKAQKLPFILPFFCKIVAATAHLSWFRDWQGLGHTLCDAQLLEGVAGGKKAITFYVLSSPLLSFHYPINLNRE